MVSVRRKMAHEVFPTFPKSSLRLITVLRVIITINVCKKLVFTDTLNLDFFHPGFHFQLYGRGEMAHDAVATVHNSMLKADYSLQNNFIMMFFHKISQIGHIVAFYSVSFSLTLRGDPGKLTLSNQDI